MFVSPTGHGARGGAHDSRLTTLGSKRSPWSPIAGIAPLGTYDPGDGLASNHHASKAMILAAVFMATAAGILSSSGLALAYRPGAQHPQGNQNPSLHSGQALKFGVAAKGQGNLPVLTRAAQVRGLTTEGTSRTYRIALRGVITFYAPDFGLTFMQDASAGIFLNVNGAAPEAHPGDVVEVEGVTGPGEFAPVVDSPRIRVVSRAPLPVARRLTAEDLLTGEQDAQWVEVRGIVHSVETREVTSADG
jgi:hypothetical protein